MIKTNESVQQTPDGRRHNYRQHGSRRACASRLALLLLLLLSLFLFCGCMVYVRPQDSSQSQPQKEDLTVAQTSVDEAAPAANAKDAAPTGTEAATKPEADEKTDETADRKAENDALPELRIGIMPAVDAAPLLLAAEEGLFEKEGVRVDLQIYTNAVSRQSALQSGDLDGAMSDAVALILNVRNGLDIRATMATAGMFPVLYKEDFSGKKEIKVGMMEVSVTNLLSDQMLAADHKLEKIYIAEIPARLTMLMEGKLDLAVLPEPIASQGCLKGLKKMILPMEGGNSPDLMVFGGKAIMEKEAAIAAFHRAYNLAAARIRENDKLARKVLLERLKLDPAVEETISLPEYPDAQLQDEAFFKRVSEWIEMTLGQDAQVPYEKLVDARFLN